MYTKKRITKLLCVMLAALLLISGSAIQVLADSKAAASERAESQVGSMPGLTDSSVDEAALADGFSDGGIQEEIIANEPSPADESLSEDALAENYPADDSSDQAGVTDRDLSEDTSGKAGGAMEDDSSREDVPKDISLADLSLADTSLTDSSLTDSLADDKVQEELLGKVRTDIAEGLYVIHSALNEKVCLGVAGSSRDNNANVELVVANGGFASAFYIKKVSDGVYSLTNYNSGKALHVKGAGKAAGTNVLQYSPISSVAQRWVISDAATSGYVTLRPTYTNLALDCAAGKSAVGTNVHLNKVVSAKRQMWKLVPASGKIAAEARLTDAAIARGYYQIGLSSHADQVLDVAAAATASGANVQIYQSNGTYAQAFEVVPSGNGLYKIRNVNSGKYLASSNGTGWSANVVQKTANNSDKSQLWYILKDPETNKLVIRPSNAHHAVLSTESNGYKSGTNVSDANFVAGSGQYWKLSKITVYEKNRMFKPASGTYYIYPAAASAKAVSVASGKLDNSANVQLTTKADSNAMKWGLYPNGDGTYVIQNVKSGKVLDILGANFTSGTNVQQYTGNKTKAQQWVFRYTGDKNGSFYIVSADSKLVLDISGARFVTGSNIWIYSKNNTSAQKYLLAKTKVTASGWVTSRWNNRYYYVNGKAVTGWKQIGEHYYHFYSDKNGIMARNTVIDGWTIDEEGRSNKPLAGLQKATPGLRTLRNLLITSVQPAGKVLYIWGGGWGGIGSDTARIGILPTWTTFYNNHAKAGYDYTQYRMQYGMGLDCSGFVGWAVYNTLYDRDGVEDLVESSSGAAAAYINRGWCYDSGRPFKPGDIVSRSGHVWLSLGTCADGSVLIMHSTPEGCQLSGTGDIAVELAQKYMKKVSPNWPFRIRNNGSGYLDGTIGKATWKVDGSGVLTDPDGMQKMSAEQVCKIIFGS
ncbi:MAG: RICIN domain-containing protein [Lachnospiraceae bacterium]|nr:RICIN domain-containing protein [Lachnospiraceae bacterium]